MTEKNIIQQRLQVQQLAQPSFSNAGEVVKWFGAMQAQDYLGALWGIGLRLNHAVEADIEKAITKKAIVRSWPMRGTLHFCSAEDLRWMLKYLTPRVIARCKTLYKQSGLDKNVFSRSRKAVEKIFVERNQLTRNEMYEALEGKRIDTGDQRGLHIISHLAQEGLICFGPRKGKQQTFVLIDEWLGSETMISQDEAFNKLCKLYFQSHGPASIEDFMWWTGLTRKEAGDSIQGFGSLMSTEKVGDNKYYFFETPIDKVKSKTILIPAYDEYTVAYKDRAIVLDPGYSAASGNGIFSSGILMNGKLAGTWRRTIEKDHVVVEIKSFEKFSPLQKKQVANAAKRYGKFIGMNVRML